MKQMPTDMGKRIRNEKGSMLLISFLLVLVFVTLAAALVTVTINESKSAERHRRITQAFHLAEAGAERALHDLRKDFLNDSSSPSWADGDINGMAIGPNTGAFYDAGYSGNTLNGGSYTVELQNVSGGQDIWIRSTGTVGDAVQRVLVYVKMVNLSPWDNVIFAGVGAAGKLINGNVDIRGSVHILGEGLASTDYAIDLGGTAELVGNNYDGLSASLLAKVPALPTTTFNGEVVETLNAELRVKNGLVGLSGDATVGSADTAGNSIKETISGSFVTDGFAGTKGTANVFSDNGWSNPYDLGDSLSFPSLSDPTGSYATYQAYLRDNALVINSAAELATLAAITPSSNFNFSGPKGSISMDGNGNMTISGIVYVEGGNLNMGKSGSDTTINYTGTASVLVTGNVQIDVNFVTAGDNSFPNNIVGIMTPNQIGFNEANIDVMGLFYAEDTITIQKQTDIMGTIVSNYFDMGTNVPDVYQVPETLNHLPPGLIGQDSIWIMSIVSWQKI